MSFRLFYIESDDVAVADIAAALPRLPAPSAPAERIEPAAPEPEPVDVPRQRGPKVNKPGRSPRSGSIAELVHDYLQEHGPTRQSDICRAIGKPSGSVGPAVKRLGCRIDDERLVHLDGAPEKKSVNKHAADPNHYASRIAALLKSEQPLELEEIARLTKIPSKDAFNTLKDDQFERDTDGMYWLAK